MQNVSSPCISVIVPVYNSDSFLIECLDSILTQTLNNIEVICIDDGSTDGSAEILGKYATQDNRVHLISQPHQGAGVARNVGLEIAQGEYIIILNSDDFFAPEMLERIYMSAHENQSDIVLFNGYQYSDKKQDIVKKGLFLNTKLFPSKPVFSWADVSDCIFNLSFNTSWCKLYARQFLLENGLRFSIQHNAEDVCFTVLSLALAKRISVVDEDLIYHRIEHPNSFQYSSHETSLYFLAEYDAIYQELIQRDLYGSLQTAFRYRMLSSILYSLKNTKTDQSRLQILGTLDTEPYCKLPIKEVPGIDDGNKEVHNLSLQLAAAQKQYHRSIDALAAIERFDQLPQKSKTNSSIKVSIVIPVYNTEDYLDEALSSIAEQTLKDIEIICINDGSTDSSLDILYRWAANDDRFIVISQPNTGQGYARNVGITRAKGEYLYFMDSDDLLELGALKQLTDIMDEKQLDSLYFDAQTFYENTELEEDFSSFRKQYIRHHAYDDIYDGPTLMRLFCEAGEYQISSCLQIHRLDFIQTHEIRFPIGILHEDNVFTFAAMLYAKRAGHIQHSYYSRRIHPNSVMTAESSFHNVYGRYKSFWEMLQIYHTLSSEIDETNRSVALSRITSVLKFAQQIYGKLSNEEKSGRFGLIENLALFNSLIGDPSTDKANIQQLNDKVSDLTAKLKESNAKRAEFFAQRNKLREEESDLIAKLKESNAKRAEFFAQRNKLREEKADLSTRLKESNAKLDELSTSLKQTREDKARINNKLQQTYEEKSEINQKLQQTYEEKSEINQKLQQTYAEKSERGIQIRAQQKTIEKLNEELATIQNSWAYRIGRFFTWPVRKIRAIRNK